MALQIKLDELVRALPQADDRFVHVEASNDEELLELEHRHVETHSAIRADDELAAEGGPPGSSAKSRSDAPRRSAGSSGPQIS